MLIRFVAKNLFSFDEETEFNVFPNKTQRLSHHKIKRNDIEILRLSAIYGANGSGKSNLINAIELLESMIEEGVIIDNVKKLKFKLNDDNEKEPISLGIEFFFESKVYYYTLTFDNEIILNEALYESNMESDKIIFERTLVGEKQKIVFFDEYAKDEKNKLFVEVLQDKLVQKNELLLTFLTKKYGAEFVDAKNAFTWFSDILVIINPSTRPVAIAHLLDKHERLKRFTNDFINTLSIGISKIQVEKRRFSEFAEGSDERQINAIIDTLKKDPERISILRERKTGEDVAVVYENEEVIAKKIVTSHLNNKGNPVDFTIEMESDGTRRLIDYLPALDRIINEERVYLIDEIERSIHPVLIKEIINKISLDGSAKGQLIFTTHESCLLDQNILRPDEIWFAQKDIDGASKLYSLSDFNIHNTANIENGYLNGRYGGIPFLSNLKDLNWHQYAVSE
jgi:uncharacterized protein